MFGTLKPILSQVSVECREHYRSTYCNLCAALSVSGAGVWNRLFLVNDVVTLDWLLSGTGSSQSSDHVFSCRNCTKGGAIGRKKNISEHQTYLAAVSSYACGVKVNDNAIDAPKLKNKSLALIYRPIMKKAEATLDRLNMLDKLRHYQACDRKHEAEQTGSLELACLPTEQSYQLVLEKDASFISTLPKSLLTILGKYFGRCVYILDAMTDMDTDKQNKQYNVLNVMMQERKNLYTKAQVIGVCLEYLKQLRHDITRQLENLPETCNAGILQSRCQSLFSSVEKQLFTLIQPLNNSELLSTLSSFSPINGSCSQCGAWSFTQVGCCTCCGCPCVEDCSCCKECDDCLSTICCLNECCCCNCCKCEG